MIFKTINNDIKAASIVLGTDLFGTAIPDELVADMIDLYIGMGGNTIDTARIYGTLSGSYMSKSEQSVGKWLKSHGGRDKIVLSTKCAHPPIDNMAQSRLSETEIEKDIDESLISLQTDYIDIEWLHRDDVNLPVEGIIDALNNMVKKGKIRCFGTSNWTGARIAAANEYALSSGQQGFSASQIKWSAAASSPMYDDDPTLVEMTMSEYAYYSKSKLPVFAYASQAKGFFYKYHKGGEAELSPKAKERYMSARNIEIYKQLLALCDRHNITLESAVLSALTSNIDFDTLSIVGCQNVQQVITSMTAADVVLDYDEVRAILGY